MKTFILLPTGIADRPTPELGVDVTEASADAELSAGRGAVARAESAAARAARTATPLEAAHTPAFDRFAREARIGLVRPVPEGVPPGSERGLLAVLGYDPRGLPVSRGGLEALALDVQLAPGDTAFRLNFVSTFRGRLADFSAGHIGGVEARLLVEALQAALGDGRWEVHAGLGYRNLLVARGGLDVLTVPPHEAQGRPVAETLPRGPQAGALLELLERAARVLAAHDVNRVRVDLGENPADRVWPWGAGGRVELEPFRLRTGSGLGLVAAVPLARGVGRAIGAETPLVPGATGHVDTSWSGKLAAALALLDRHDIVLLHLAAANEASHSTDPRLKLRVIEEMDRFVLAPLLAALARRGDTRLLLTTDHATASAAREDAPTHVPFGLWAPGRAAAAGAGRAAEGGRARRFTEAAAAASDLRVEEGHTLLEYALRGALPALQKASA